MTAAASCAGGDSWVTTFTCNRTTAQRLTSNAPEIADLDPLPVIVAAELDEAADRWQLDIYTETRPPPALLRLFGQLIGVNDQPEPQRLPPTDWVTLSQQGLAPVRAGRFFVHTASHAPDDGAGVVNLCIEASQAFGTGHHETTAGCLTALDALHLGGQRYTNIADIGTGTGLLAFAALHLWPRARAIASDIDPVSVRVTIDNAQANDVPLGSAPGALTVVAADGTRHPAIVAAAPFDLVIANILAGPLIALAPALASILAPGGTLILAGLLSRQRSGVISAYRRFGLRFDTAGDAAEWPALRLTMRQRPGWRRPLRSDGGAGQSPGDFGTW